MSMNPEAPVDVLRRWEEHGATWRAVHVSDDRAIVDLCTCTGEPVERMESSDPELIRFVRTTGAADRA
jgi:hypothetical protein